MKIAIKDAVVKTAQVEIRVLSIEGKQVTLAVFRQLQQEPLIDDRTGEFFGVPWGTVNYHWAACPLRDHRHVVWQKGDELRRALIFGDAHVNRSGLKGVGDWLEHALRLYWWLEHPDHGRPMGNYITPPYLVCIAPYKWSLKTLWWADVYSPENHRERIDIPQQWGTAELGSAILEANEKYCNMLSDIRVAEKRYMAALQSLEGLPQLFIAV